MVLTVTQPDGRSSTPVQSHLAELLPLDDEALVSWAIDHPERLNLEFLGWLAEEEVAAAAGNEKEALWELGSKLMAVREGLAPVGMAALQAELRMSALAAAQRASSSNEDDGRTEDGGSRAGGQGSTLLHRSAGLASLVQRTAALGLSPEGLGLLHQQAAALEAAVGVQRARALTEVIGRKSAMPGEMLRPPPMVDDAVRS